MAGAVRVSTAPCTYGCMREIFESRYFRDVPNDLPVATDMDAVEAAAPDFDDAATDDDDVGAAATANIHTTNIELQWKTTDKTKYFKINNNKATGETHEGNKLKI